MKKLVDIQNICKSFDDNEVLKHINLYIRENEFITLLGPSGCGKTTLLRLIGGFETADEGRILFDGAYLDDLPPHMRKINTVFQKYALFPHLNVYGNIAFGLKMKKMPKAETDEAVAKALKLVKLEGFEHRNVKTLSGGQQQRVAIARAVVNKPKLLLLDEPLAALDLKLRQDMQYELKEMQRALGITFVYVTHDQEEALTMSDTVVVMRNGEILQIGTPEDIYNEPKTRFVASFIGESNIIPGTMVKDYLVTFENHTFACIDKGFGENAPVDVVLRPEDIELTQGDQGIVGTVTDITFKGVHYEIIVMVAEREYIVHSTDMQPVGAKVKLNFDKEDIHVMRRDA
ncbi:MAG: ABC transporter ATP-binding protein [Acholeplasmatales bacterium]|nr:MAG: ABC transporter ATP-binding protein [Acholeplasmatales bacterium]